MFQHSKADSNIVKISIEKMNTSFRDRIYGSSSYHKTYRNSFATTCFKIKKPEFKFSDTLCCPVIQKHFLVNSELCVIAVRTPTFCSLVYDSDYFCVLVLAIGRTVYFGGRLNHQNLQNKLQNKHLQNKQFSPVLVFLTMLVYILFKIL